MRTAIYLSLPFQCIPFIHLQLTDYSLSLIYFPTFVNSLGLIQILLIDGFIIHPN